MKRVCKFDKTKSENKIQTPSSGLYCHGITKTDFTLSPGIIFSKFDFLEYCIEMVMYDTIRECNCYVESVRNVVLHLPRYMTIFKV